MATKITVSIPEPCHENWQGMTVVERGRFCASCQKNVIDFTTSSDRQIINAFHDNENLCGRFNNNQLNRELILPKEKNSMWLATSSIVISFLGLGSQAVNAQEKIITEQTDQKILSENPSTSNIGEEREITGIVSDETGPLLGANIYVRDTTTEVQTDGDGKFSLRARDGDVLVCSYTGMIPHEYTLGPSKNNYLIQMTVNNYVEVTGGEPRIIVEKRRSFFGRLFRKNK